MAELLDVDCDRVSFSDSALVILRGMGLSDREIGELRVVNPRQKAELTAIVRQKYGDAAFPALREAS